ncbi:hypothetical protein JHK82_017447 [Glycine max]|nr:hypothetical protein JHK82_017447 [Glycine max]
MVAATATVPSNGRWSTSLRRTPLASLFMFRPRPCIPVDDVDDVPKDGRPPTKEELHQFFLPFRGFCARKGITTKELVLHDLDVPSALTNYVVVNCVSTVVVGAAASPWNTLTRSTFLT